MIERKEIVNGTYPCGYAGCSDDACRVVVHNGLVEFLLCSEHTHEFINTLMIAEIEPELVELPASEEVM
jgi:hypothetical protein